MRYRRFGRTGWNVSEIGYGMWGMGGWTGSDDAESLDSLELSAERGVNFFDTAWAYGNGHSEQLLGKLLRANAGKGSRGGPDHKLYAASTRSTSSSCTPGKTRGSTIRACLARSSSCAKAAKSAPLGSA